MIYELPGMEGNNFWHKTQFKVLEVKPAFSRNMSRYYVTIVRGNGESVAGDNMNFVWDTQHNFKRVGSILNE